MNALKLVALDDQDLGIVSAHVQDAVMKVSDLEFLPSAKRFVLTMNRFVWEAKSGLLRQHNERRQSVLHFDRVLGAKTSFIAIDRPGGIIELIFSGGGAIMLDVECIEARLADIGGAWGATSRPVHRT
jgi:Protein of unknown function (DUF2948)